MSQFAHKLVMWSVIVLLLLIGVFLQVRSARGQMPEVLSAAPGESSVAIFIRGF